MNASREVCKEAKDSNRINNIQITSNAGRHSNKELCTEVIELKNKNIKIKSESKGHARKTSKELLK